jgi:hypothetical protein
MSEEEGIIILIAATKIWHDSPLQQFMTAYKLRLTVAVVLIWNVLMLLASQRGKPSLVLGLIAFWSLIVLSTAFQAIFFAKRVDPAIRGSYMADATKHCCEPGWHMAGILCLSWG